MNPSGTPDPQRSFDRVLMDCQMQELDGYAASEAVRAGENQARKRTPIIALTANAIPGDTERALACGMDDYRTKPVRLGDLHTTLSRWLVPAG